MGKQEGKEAEGAAEGGAAGVGDSVIVISPEMMKHKCGMRGC